MEKQKLRGQNTCVDNKNLPAYLPHIIFQKEIIFWNLMENKNDTHKNICEQI